MTYPDRSSFMKVDYEPPPRYRTVMAPSSDTPNKLLEFIIHKKGKDDTNGFIRTATPADLEQITGVLQRSRITKTAQLESAGLAEQKSLIEAMRGYFFDEMEKYLPRVLRTPENCLPLVACIGREDDHEIKGFQWVDFYKRLPKYAHLKSSGYSTENMAVMEAIAVDKSVQGLKIGQLMYLALFQEIQRIKENINRLSLEIYTALFSKSAEDAIQEFSTPNLASQRLHMSIGAKIIGSVEAGLRELEGNGPDDERLLLTIKSDLYELERERTIATIREKFVENSQGVFTNEYGLAKKVEYTPPQERPHQ